MKHLRLLFVAILITGVDIVALAQYNDYGAYHKDMEFIIHAGALKSDLRYAKNDAFDVGIDYTPYEADDFFSYSFITNFCKGEDYWSVNPLGASAIILCVFTKNIVDRDETLKTMLMIMSAESMSLNFAMGSHFELSPYWSLLRLSKWQEGATYVTGGVGLRANCYFGPKNRFSLRARGEYSWGYGNADWYGERIYNLFGPEDEDKYHYSKYEKPHTPFKGWSYGISLGYRF